MIAWTSCDSSSFATLDQQFHVFDLGVNQKVLTLTGIREVFVLAFLHVETRHVILSPATFHPNEAWVASQAASIVDAARTQGLRVRCV